MIDTTPRSPRRLPRLIQIAAGLIGAAGVAVGAAAAHAGGGGVGATAAVFMLIHAAALLGLSALATVQPRSSRGLAVASLLMAGGTALFSGDLALAGLFGLRPWPSAAPIGGMLLIAGWLATAAVPIIAGLQLSR